MPARTATLRTRVYIDGYNLYYGCLRGTPYKWLDPLTLFEQQILPSVLYRRSPEASPNAARLLPLGIKYFTACIIESAARAHDSVSSQRTYHNALRRMHGERIELVQGYYLLTQSNQQLVPSEDAKRWPRYCEKALVWKLEEKQSDVNFALHLYDDALSGEVDQVVVVTNDTDIAPALGFVRKRTNVVIGLVIPTRESLLSGGKEREVNNALAEHAHWVRRYISVSELERAQLPTMVRGTRQNSIKPHTWYPRPDLLDRVIEAAIPIKSRRGDVLKWMEIPNPYLGGARPIKLVETDEGAALVLEYIENYIRDRIAK